MKINNLNGIQPVPNTKNINNAVSIEKPKSTDRTDNMEVSANAQLVQKAIQKAKEIPDIREEKVKELAAKIDAGEFVIDSNTIAKKMLGQ
jgi:negative regulator of flagellin synthesis FlgM